MNTTPNAGVQHWNLMHFLTNKTEVREEHQTYPRTNGAAGTCSTEVPDHASSHSATATSIGSRLRGKSAAMVTFSPYPHDPRVRRAVDALLQEGMNVDLLCVADGKSPKREILNGLDVRRLPIKNSRGGKLAYAYQYAVLILLSSAILAFRSLRRRYDLVHVHNMPDILVVSALIPKMLGAKVILDLHDPMPELMMTIFGRDKDSLSVRLMKRLEKWSIARADLVFTVNIACKRIFASRSCRPEKIGVVMNSPDGEIFSFRKPRPRAQLSQAHDKRFVIMYHGSLVERNGLDLAVDAIARVRQAIPAVELRIYGRSTPFLERVLSAAGDKGLNEAVRYLGSRRLEDLVPEILDCDMGVIPNHRNAFTEINTPTRIFEYLALGKPVVAPRTPGIEDYFSKDSLVFFDSGDSEDLARKIEHVYAHPAEAIAIAERGQRVYLAHIWPQEREAFLNLTSELLA